MAIDEKNGQLAGHILLSKIVINNGSKKVESLAPISVSSDYQKIGVGSALI